MDDNWQPGTASDNPSRPPVPPGMNGFAQAIKSWAGATSTGDSKAAQQAALAAFTWASEEALRNPTPDFLLQQEADELESQGKWSEAEAVRQKVLDLSETTGNFGRLARAQMDLSGLLRLTEAINYRRQSEGPHARLALARALEKLGELSRAMGDVASGEQARSEAQSIRRDLQLPCSP
jgi:hypothetical protein